MKSLSAILAMLFCAAPLLAQTPSTADAEYLLVEHHFTLRDDGSTVYTYHHKLKYLTSYGFSRAYGESFIVYNPTWQKLTIDRSVTTMANGQVVSAPFNAFNEVLPGYAAQAPAYLHLREMVVTHTGLEIGAVVDFSYTITSKPGMLPGLMGKVLFGERSPIARMVVTVDIPAKATLKYAMVRDAAVLPSIAAKDGRQVFTWEKSELPIYEVEAMQPAMDEVLPALVFSTVTLKDCASHVAAGIATGKATRRMSDMVKANTTGSTDKRDTALKLRGWVADNVARAPLPLDMQGYIPAKAEFTFEKRSGSDLDRAVLLAQLCREAGVDAVAALASRDLSGAMSATDDALVAQGVAGMPDVPALQLFTRAVVLCRDASFDGGMLVLDPASAQSGPLTAGTAAAMLLPLDNTAAMKDVLPLALPKAIVRMTSDWTLREDGTVAGKTLLHAQGYRSYAFDGAAMQRALRQGVQSAAQGLTVTPGAMQSANAFVSTCEADLGAGTPLKATAGYARFALPTVPGGVAELRFVPADVRRTSPVQLPSAMVEEQFLTLHLPSGVEVVDAAAQRELSNAVGSVRSVITVDGESVEVKRTLRIDVQRVQPTQYEDFAALLRIWLDPSHTQLLLRMPTK